MITLEEVPSFRDDIASHSRKFRNALGLARALESALTELAGLDGADRDFRLRLARAQALGLTDLIKELSDDKEVSDDAPAAPRPISVRSCIFPVASVADDSPARELADTAVATSSQRNCA